MTLSIYKKPTWLNFREAYLLIKLFKNFQRSGISFSSSFEISKNFLQVLEAPKQRAGKKVTTSAMTPSPPPTIERPIAGRGFSLFLEIFFISFEAKFWLSHCESTAIHHGLVISRNRTLLILILANFRGFSSPLIS